MKDLATSRDGVPISYEVHGTGEPALLFVHGWSCDRKYWNGQLGHFAETYRVVALDLAGHGESGLGRKAWTMQAFGRDVVAVAEKVGLENAVLVGHSMGGDVIVEAASLMSHQIAGLVWADTYRSLRRPRDPREVENIMAPFRVDFVAATREFVNGMFVPRSDKALVDWVVADMSAAPPKIALRAMEQSITFDREIPARLGKLKVPIVAINPDYRPTDIDSLQRHGIKVVLMSGVGHFLMMEDPGTFNRLLEEVIEEIWRNMVNSNSIPRREFP